MKIVKLRWQLQSSHNRKTFSRCVISKFPVPERKIVIFRATFDWSKFYEYKVSLETEETSGAEANKYLIF